MRRVDSGCPEPLGVTLVPGGVNVAVFSAHASAIEICIFDASGQIERERVALPERTGDVFHGFVAGVDAGCRYGLRAHGPYDPRNGHRFNPAKLLVDPYARLLDRAFVLHPSLFGQSPGGTARDDTDSAPFVPKAIAQPDAVAAAASRPGTPWPRTFVYELHVRGFTKLHPGIPEPLRGTCAGLTHPAALAHLVRLGVTTVELMPVAAAIDDWHLGPLGLTNYWGYNPVVLMVPDVRLAPGGVAELADCVAAFHEAGIEVLLDVVLNHSGEGDARGPTLSFRGLDNATYYRVDAAGSYVDDDTRCGNALALDRGPVMRLALDALRYYAATTGIDGFRFDLATTLGRTERGFDPAAPMLAAIAQDPVLRELKLVAEPWDVGNGGYRLGGFGPGFREWNDRYRDAVRRFWRGDARMTGDLATRIAGSADVFGARRRPPSCSVNFVAAHDGFTLRDLVSFERKHNDANGEDNRDGTDGNFSWHHGIEGSAADLAIEEKRGRAVRNLLTTLFVSRGTPMLAMGDESGRTQNGNNNAYSQDNATSWLDWAAMDEELCAFVASLTALRRGHATLCDDRWLRGEPADATGVSDVEWRHPDGSTMTEEDWAHPEGRVLVVALYAPATGDAAADRVTIALNAGDREVAIRWPDARDGFRWRRAVDTALPTGVRSEGDNGDVIAARSAVVLVEEAQATRKARDAGIEPDVLDRLAHAAGIARTWTDVTGRAHVVGDDTRRALLAAMGLGAATTGQARAHLAELAARRERRVLPRALVVAEGAAARIAIAVGERQWPRRGALLVQSEGDETLGVPFTVDDLPGEPLVAADGGSVFRRFVALPPLTPGTYTVTIEDRRDSACRLIVAPRACYLPPAVRGGGRRFGLAAHLYALRRQGDQGIGDFTTLLETGASTARAGGAVVALNPLHALFSADRERASPYQPSDRRFLDPIYIDVARVPDLAASPQARRMLDQHSGVIARLSAQPTLDYAGVWQVKRAVLAECFRTFETRDRDDALVAAFDRFASAGGPALMRFATFEAIAAAHPNSAWADWPPALRQPESAAVTEFAQSHADGVRFARYLQWLADSQLADAAAASRAGGLALGFCRDLAIGAARDGAESWSTQAALARGVSIGAPPDPFAVDGQNWSLPPPIPQAQHDEGYEGFRALIRANVRHAGLLRIDHVMGLTRLFWIPDGARGADGAYVRYPIEDLLGVLALESERARCAIVGEDLGTVPEGLRERLARADVLSYQPLWFQKDGATFRPPSRYSAKAVACVSTHDLPTFAGWWNGADIAERHALRLLDDNAASRARDDRQSEKDALAAAVRAEGLAAFTTADPARAHDAGVTRDIHRFVGAAPAMLVLLQADDLAAETVAQNLPGTDRERPNWRRKIGTAAAELWHTESGEAASRDLADSRGRTDTDDETAAR